MLPTPTPTPTPPPLPSPHHTALTSTTAPGKTFSTRLDLQTHYKSDWHRYNLKRRENNLPMLNEEEFNARLEAAVALRREREGREERNGVDHLKEGKKGKQTKTVKGTKKDNRRKPTFAKRAGKTHDSLDEDRMEDDAETTSQDDTAEQNEPQQDEEEALPEINPNQSLFDNRISPTLETNLLHMTNTYSFFVPDIEYLVDLEGLVGYCSEKIRLGHTCLYCQRIFTSGEGCMKHMRDKRHCKILYERGVDQEEFDVFYDFEEANAMFLGTKEKSGEGDAAMDEKEDSDEEDDGGDEDGKWEDVEDNEEGDTSMMEGDDDDDLYAAYREEIATHGFDITPLGELIFPDGRIIGHRGLARYYKQRFAPDRMERAAVRAARVAAGDRLYGGRVVNVYRLRGEMQEHENESGEGGALVTMGRLSGSIPTGRNGNGILVSAGGSSSTRGGFTALSLYRYRAAVKKQRREDDKGRRLQYRTRQNMNKMGKKGNILSTGFCTAQAPR